MQRQAKREAKVLGFGVKSFKKRHRLRLEYICSKGDRSRSFLKEVKFHVIDRH